VGEEVKALAEVETDVAREGMPCAVLARLDLPAMPPVPLGNTPPLPDYGGVVYPAEAVSMRLCGDAQNVIVRPPIVGAHANAFASLLLVNVGNTPIGAEVWQVKYLVAPRSVMTMNFKVPSVVGTPIELQFRSVVSGASLQPDGEGGFEHVPGQFWGGTSIRTGRSVGRHTADRNRARRRRRPRRTSR
jgi:hypothetical protein